MAEFSSDNALPAVAIVILNWNGSGYLKKFLPSVIASSYPNKRIIVADNASTDDSLEVLKMQFPNVEILINPSNEGYAKGYNTALKQVKADIFVLLNSDVEVTPDWIEPAVELMKQEGIAACQPKVLSYHDKSKFEYAGAAGGWIDNFGYPFARGRVFDVCETDSGQYNDAAPCFWATGAALFIRSVDFHAMDGFDEFFFAHQEEIDLCWRLQLAGKKVYVQPASVVYHVGGGTLAMESPRKTFYNFRNNLVMLHKNLPLSQWWKIPFRMVLDWVAAAKLLLNGQAGNFIAIIKGHFHFIGWMLSNKKTKKAAGKGELRGIYNGSVVYAHFIKKKNTFGQIVSDI